MPDWKKIGISVLGFLSDNIHSVTVVNNDGNPQLMVQPKGIAKVLIDDISKEIENGKAKKEDKSQT
jgi:hypothetical protein